MRTALALTALLGAAAPVADEPPSLTDLLASVGRSVRNVLAIDRKPVPDSHQRLGLILADPEPDAPGRFRRLRDESARFNIGGIHRNVSDPILPLQFVDPDRQARFQFTLAGSELFNCITVWKLTFAERMEPTMIAVDGHSAVSHGAIWVTSSGIVLRTRLELEDPATHVTMSMVVSYGRDARLAEWVPMHMEETYVQVQDATVFAPTFRNEITCVATYSSFRRFETSARIVPPR
jgi:hypothetical protein